MHYKCFNHINPSTVGVCTIVWVMWLGTLDLYPALQVDVYHSRCSFGLLPTGLSILHFEDGEQTLSKASLLLMELRNTCTSQALPVRNITNSVFPNSNGCWHEPIWRPSFSHENMATSSKTLILMVIKHCFIVWTWMPHIFFIPTLTTFPFDSLIIIVASVQKCFVFVVYEMTEAVP